MIDTIIELLTKVEDELLYNEDSWGTLTEDQVDKLIHARCKVVNVISMIVGVDRYINSFHSLIKFMR